MKLFELLNKNTRENFGSWTLTYNEHHCCYIHRGNYPNTYENEVINYYIKKEQCQNKYNYLAKVEDFKNHVKDFNNVYELTWYKHNQVGNLCIYGSSINEIEKQIEGLVESEE